MADPRIESRPQPAAGLRLSPASHPAPKPREIRSAAEIRATPERCGLCGGWSRCTRLSFSHDRADGRLILDMHLCTTCGDRIEKHLKRAIPLRSMEIIPLREAG
ncbi:MAG TPA: hypothetical protein VHG28_20215 [Longimicrobiaceae bacterium]|nr:hypothetical protein [Longimicrobiaceae bacterium]